MSNQTVTVPDGGTVLVITKEELSALRAFLYGIDSISLIMAPDHIRALYQLAMEVREI